MAAENHLVFDTLRAKDTLFALVFTLAPLQNVGQSSLDDFR